MDSATLWNRMTFINCFSSSFFLHSHDSSLLSYCDDNLVNHAAGRSAGRPRQRDHRGAQQPGKLCERLVGRDQHLTPFFWTTGYTPISAYHCDLHLLKKKVTDRIRNPDKSELPLTFLSVTCVAGDAVSSLATASKWGGGEDRKSHFAGEGNDCDVIL